MEESINTVILQQEKLQINEIISSVSSPDCGAISTFIGTTRDTFESKKVEKLEYEAYEPMALKEINKICLQIREKWNIKHISIYHRLGAVPVGESSVVIAISSPHRNESIEAVKFAIDTLKSSVPIWKKEIYNQDVAEWKENKECLWASSNKDKIIRGFAQVYEKLCDNKKIIKQLEENLVGKIEIDPRLVQISASTEELNRRIESFINRKRHQVDNINVQEFCYKELDEENEFSCARVDAVLIRRNDSKSHVRVHRVCNSLGPQLTSAKVKSEPNGDSNNDTERESLKNSNPLLEERLSGPEKFLGIGKPVPRDIYQRIKNIEDRLLYLESLSPEYKDFYLLNDSETENNSYKLVRKRTFSVAELDKKIFDLENKYSKKQRNI